jgi:hypothetical protein
MMQFRANYLYTSIAGGGDYYQASFKVEQDRTLTLTSQIS